LAILRIAVAVNAITQGICMLIGSSGAVSSTAVLGLSAIVGGLLFLIGFLTPIVGSFLAVGYLIESIPLVLGGDAAKHAEASTCIYLASISLAVALLGPGAFSVDARLFGRLEIIIPERPGPHN